MTQWPCFVTQQVSCCKEPWNLSPFQLQLCQINWNPCVKWPPLQMQQVGCYTEMAIISSFPILPPVHVGAERLPGGRCGGETRSREEHSHVLTGRHPDWGAKVCHHSNDHSNSKAIAMYGTTVIAIAIISNHNDSHSNNHINNNPIHPCYEITPLIRILLA